MGTATPPSLDLGLAASYVPPSDAEFVGIYVLISIDGAAVPTTIVTDDGAAEVTGGQLVFVMGGACTGSILVREPGGGPVQEMMNTCAWARTGNQVSLTWSDGATDQATLQGRRVSLVAADMGGLVLLFEK